LLRIAVTGLIIFINFILQSTLFDYISIGATKPNTAVVIIVCYAILRGDVEGSIVGFISGLIHDIFFGRVIGLFALLGALIGFFCGKPFKNFYSESFMLPIILVAVSSLFYEIGFYFFDLLFTGQVDVLFYFWAIILPSAVYSTILSVPIYRLIYGINSRLEEREKARRKLF
jgi:rod shape-determining protein MreD